MRSSSADLISSTDAGMILHRLATERIRVIVFFVSGDGCVTATLRGSVNSFSEESGLTICTPIDDDEQIAATLEFPYDLVAKSTILYSTDTQLIKNLVIAPCLRFNMPNGNNLTIMELRDR